MKDCELNEEIKKIVANRQFWADCEYLLLILKPLMSVVGSLESKSATLADCYKEVINLAAATESMTGGPDIFRSHCLAAFGNRRSDINDDIYLLSYFLHPSMHGKGMMSGIFTRVAQKAAELWKRLENGKISTMKLLSRLMKYKKGEVPYDLPYSDEYMNATLWWQTTEDSVGMELKILAVKLLSVTLHSAACERSFSVLSWIHSKSRNKLMLNRLEAIAKIYLYNISHQQREHQEPSSSHSTVNSFDNSWESNSEDEGEETEETNETQVDLSVSSGFVFSNVFKKSVQTTN